ncbi:MAG TPA: hypothetical protein VE732_09105 [Nitrososphaera sp.]|jgi:hypothetical protein|nr:hypothetical protein [Nitrososphaera sp.]
MHKEEYIYVCNFSDSLSIHVSADPNSFDGRAHDKSRWIGLTFDALDKEALFFRALKVFNPAASVGGRIPIADYHRGKWDELMAQFDHSIEQATAELPMLRRFKEEYEDAVFSPDEVGFLRDECLHVCSGTQDEQALTSLGKLIQACDEALKEGWGLFFASN